MSRTARYRNKQRFSSREEWAQWACNVARSSGGAVRLNLWSSRTRRLHRACEHARELGLMTCAKRQPRSETYYILVQP